MNILFNVTTRRGIISILPLMRELGSRGHGIYTLVTTHPSMGLKYPHRFMVGENSGMLELLDGIKYTLHSRFETNADLDRMMADITSWGIDLHITKGDSGMPRDAVLCSAIRRRLPGVRILCQQADFHMHVQRPWYSEHFMVMGPRWATYLESQGVSDDIITPVGCIKGDYLRGLPHLSDDYITFFSQMNYSNEVKGHILTALDDMAGDLGKTAVIKLHPAWIHYRVDEWGWWEDRINGLYNTLLKDHDDAYELMRHSALVVTASSNTGYEAMIMGIPAVVLNIGESQHWYRNCGVDVYSVDELRPMYDRILAGTYDTEALSSWQVGQYYINDGLASSRAADMVEGI